ncbi:MAG: RNA methyltransferase [Pseudomonadota bacterium]
MTKSRARKRPHPVKRFGSEKPARDTVWLWGQHAVVAALANPKRRHTKLLATRNASDRIGQVSVPVELVGGDQIEKTLPPGAVHQGLALETRPLDVLSVEDVIDSGARRIAVLDQVSDPHNLGAILRSAAAFGFEAILLQTRNAPMITGVAAKSAAGAVETVAECRVVNVSRALGLLAEAGFHTVGLAGGSNRTIDAAVSGAERLALVLGAEGAGLRPGVAKACAECAHIPIAPAMESLNVSNAAAIAFYLARAS